MTLRKLDLFENWIQLMGRVGTVICSVWAIAFLYTSFEELRELAAIRNHLPPFTVTYLVDAESRFLNLLPITLILFCCRLLTKGSFFDRKIGSYLFKTGMAFLIILLVQSLTFWLLQPFVRSEWAPVKATQYLSYGLNLQLGWTVEYLSLGLSFIFFGMMASKAARLEEEQALTV